ncbi:glycosyltransferase [Cetobacterium somerae]|uniref:glycosyltransferase n=1 Tax=Cetobacterium somerae TaxID=188913 RepID=UPI00211F0E2B|nr:glycosyltransferase [Cetobacterium somerae]MCQ9626454.1 glycosyltransferase [Cetobacterium somerae]
MSPKISIIVPVYKVELYLRKCIDSILNQTFKDFELILVDDGSPDRCGEICDEYRKKDNRIKVLHKKNGGLSSARNAGLDIAKGDYIGFVDSDDWIESDMYEVLYNLCIENNSEIGVINYQIVYPDRQKNKKNSDLKIFNKKEAMDEILKGRYFEEIVWSKLFKKEAIEKIRFKEHIKYEDTDFTYRVIHKCEKISYLGKSLYNYLIREGSTMDMISKEIVLDYIYIYDEMYEFYKNNQLNSKEIILLKLIDSGLNTLNEIIKNDFLEIKIILDKYFYKFLKIKKIHKKTKFLLIILKLNPSLYIKMIKKLFIKEKLK